MADLTEVAMAQLAREMVMCIRNYQAIFADFGITEEDYYEICKNEFYKRVKDHYTIEWNSTVSTADRIRLQGQAGTEVLMPLAIKRAMQPTEPLANVIETMKMVAKIGGIGETKANPQAAADRFVITINLGADTEVYNKSIEINPNDVNLGDDNGKVIEQRPSEVAVEFVRPPREG
jgi:hypothetical protein